MRPEAVIHQRLLHSVVSRQFAPAYPTTDIGAAVRSVFRRLDTRTAEPTGGLGLALRSQLADRGKSDAAKRAILRKKAGLA